MYVSSSFSHVMIYIIINYFPTQNLDFPPGIVAPQTDLSLSQSESLVQY
ncbi:MAG: hypothetical protein ACI90V_012077 [Bacillariaceae sp.]|jgi:hypothetical protein